MIKRADLDPQFCTIHMGLSMLPMHFSHSSKLSHAEGRQLVVTHCFTQHPAHAARPASRSNESNATTLPIVKAVKASSTSTPSSAIEKMIVSRTVRPNWRNCPTRETRGRGSTFCGDGFEDSGGGDGDVALYFGVTGFGDRESRYPDSARSEATPTACRRAMQLA
jgi:hypothetical protein